MTAPTTARTTAAIEKRCHSDAVVEDLAVLARAILAKNFPETSQLRDCRAEFPTFEGSEVKLGKMLGKGGFSTVYEVRALVVAGNSSLKNSAIQDNQEPEYDQQHDSTGESLRLFLAQHCLRNNGDARYCLKQLSPELVADPQTFKLGMTDLAIETRFMVDIMHTNICKIRAIAKTYEPDGLCEGYFIIMDRLYDTLEDRIYKTWQKADNFQKSAVGKIFDIKGKKRSDKFEKRLLYAYDLSAAINYLHKRKILYRDLKPPNIGFDIRDDIKLFDFGLSRSENEDLKVDDQDNLYNYTADTGSPRYMAPEVHLGNPYNNKCDTYAFCVLFWEMLALKTPYLLYTVKKMEERVFSDMAIRPKIDKKWPVTIQTLFHRGWTPDINERISMDEVENILRKELAKEVGGDDRRLNHSRRRSTFIFKQPS